MVRNALWCKSLHESIFFLKNSGSSFMYNHVTGDQFLSEITNQIMLSVLVIYLFILYFFLLFLFSRFGYTCVFCVSYTLHENHFPCVEFQNFKFIFWVLTCFIFVQQNGTKGILLTILVQVKWAFLWFRRLLTYLCLARGEERPISYALIEGSWAPFYEARLPKNLNLLCKNISESHNFPNQV